MKMLGPPTNHQLRSNSRPAASVLALPSQAPVSSSQTGASVPARIRDNHWKTILKKRKGFTWHCFLYGLADTCEIVCKAFQLRWKNYATEKNWFPTYLYTVLTSENFWRRVHADNQTWKGQWHTDWRCKIRLHCSSSNSAIRNSVILL